MQRCTDKHKSSSYNWCFPFDLVINDTRFQMVTAVSWIFKCSATLCRVDR